MTKLDANRLDRIGDWMQRYVDARKYPGSSVLIRSVGDEVYYAERGYRSVENSLPFARDTIARIYSMTKPVTSVAAMMLVEEHLQLTKLRIHPQFALELTHECL